MPISEPIVSKKITMKEVKSPLKPADVRQYCIMKGIDGKMYVHKGGKQFDIEAQAKTLVMNNFIAWLRPKCGVFRFQPYTYKTMGRNFLIKT